MASSLGLILFLDLVSGNDADSFSTLVFDLGLKEMIKPQSKIKEDCVCQKRLGKGFDIPFSVAD
jgi:hypothetical protein